MDSLSPAPLRIDKIIDKLGLGPDDVEPFGWFKGKLALGLEQKLANRPRGKYVVVSGMSPTPLGEGKTVSTIGLSMALCREGFKAIPTIRQPSQAPVFGIKGGGAGGGKASLLPFEDINLHFTGDLHAVAAANNLLAAVLDNHLQRNQSPQIDLNSITWRRALDVNDKGLRNIITGIAREVPLRETGFDLTAASEVMAILALTTGLEDLRRRLGRIVIGQTPSGEPVKADDLRCAGSMAALMREAIRPNLVQTAENTPAFVHAGPFANIAHGNCSILADQAALRLADFVLTEAGFGSDCGTEKFCHIKCRTSGLEPDGAVLVCTIRALKFQSGRFNVQPGKPLPPDLVAENLEALRAGAVNLQAHIGILRQFGMPVVVAINRFPDDGDRELEEVRRIAIDSGAAGAAIADPYSRGGEGSRELARTLIKACQGPRQFRYLYDLDSPAEEKIQTLATRIYGADAVDYEPLAKKQLDRYRKLGYGNLPICIAKTQYSLSHDPKLLGRPSGFRFPIREVRLAAGAGFLYALAGEIRTMPGLPGNPAAARIDLAAGPQGAITGLT